MTQKPLFGPGQYDPDRDLVIRARRAAANSSLQARGLRKLLAELADALESRVDGLAARAGTDEANLREAIDEGPRLAALAWADLLEEGGGGRATAAGHLRWLARERKWPGALGGAYRWAANRFPRLKASWVLPAAVVGVLDGRPVPAAAEAAEALESQTSSAFTVVHRFPSVSEALLQAAVAFSGLDPRGAPQ